MESNTNRLVRKHSQLNKVTNTRITTTLIAIYRRNDIDRALHHVLSSKEVKKQIESRTAYLVANELL